MQMEFARKVVIVGASAGGASVAARLRRLDEDAQIVMFDKSAVISYATCGIPYFLGGVIRNEKRLRISSPEDFSKVLNVDVRTNVEVISIDRRKRCVLVYDHTTGKQYEESYHKLVLSPGSKSKPPEFDGANVDQVFTVRGYEDNIAIKNFIEKKNCKNAVIVGGGFIGLEMAENLHRLGMHVTVIERGGQVLNVCDHEMAAMTHRHIINKKVSLILNDHIISAHDNTVLLAGGTSVKAEIIILAIGVLPDTTLAKDSGLQIGEHSGIEVNCGMVTSDEHIYALGDAVAVVDKIVDNKVLSPLAGPAYKQARVVAENLCGLHSNYRPVYGNSIVKIFDLTVAMVGATESQLKKDNIAYKKSYTESQSIAEYYPGAHSMIIKLLFTQNTGRLLGAQIVGVNGVDKRIDILATAIHMNMTVMQIMDLELAYAPPYSAAKDPVNIAAMVATNMLKFDYQVVHWDELEKFDPKTSVLIDIRSQEEFEIRSLKGAINIPLEELRQRLDEVPEEKRIIVFCSYGKKGYFAHNILKHYGFQDVYNISGGLTVFNMATSSAFSDSSSSKPEAQILPPVLEEIILEESSAKTTGKKQPEVINVEANNDVFEVDACGMSCPGPIMKLATTMNKANQGDIVKISATDNGFAADIKIWCKNKGYRLLKFDNSTSTILAVLQKS